MLPSVQSSACKSWALVVVSSCLLLELGAMKKAFQGPKSPLPLLALKIKPFLPIYIIRGKEGVIFFSRVSSRGFQKYIVFLQR